MVDAAKVNIFGTSLGTVMWDSKRETALFEYASDFISKAT